MKSKSDMKYLQGTHVRLEKVEHLPEASYTQDELNQSQDGNRRNGLPSGYSLEGTLESEIEVGLPLIVARTKRNEVACKGTLSTSEVVEVAEGLIRTHNSTYTITPL